MKFFKKSLYSFIAILLFLSTAVTAAATEETTKAEAITYVALGDSIAAGVTPYNELGLGYADFVKQELESRGKVVEFHKEFAVPGYNTTQVLADLSKPELQAALAEAELVTISAGANDLLKIAKIDAEAGTVSFDLEEATAALTTTGENIAKIVGTIKTINPAAEVYVSDYVFPFPYLEGQALETVALMFEQMNSTIHMAGELAGGKTFSVTSLIGFDSAAYMPNPQNVHPNEDGYKKMTEAFFTAYDGKVVYEDISGHWAEEAIQHLVDLELMTGATDTEFLPNQVITRAEAASYLYGMIPMTKNIPADPGFKDVPQDHPNYMAIAKLVEAGVFSKAANFNPDAPLTRAQLAIVIAKAFQVQPGEKLVSFTDVKAGYWAELYIQSLASNGYVSGYTNGSFGVNDGTTRAQFAAVVYRVFLDVKVELMAAS
ncbi:hypothetical protein GCM10008967_02890 [Bacillus carboniphilus]|uniref:SLH domain-containing protein n=1 Tax=Bacillus carboniphilus TaxID=86663 RepID=A0ABP3FHI0_9BACI